MQTVTSPGKPKAYRLGVGLRIAAFRRREDGSMIVFGLFIFLLMLMVSGMAIDMMRVESIRARMQGTLDRAVLAAAAMNQPLPPTQVVNEYFARADLKDYLTEVIDDTGFGYRSVSATAEADMGTTFMALSGVETLRALAQGTAEERTNKVEISLVLDVSGSMGRNNKATLLKDAATDFVSKILTGGTEDESFINVVPYYSQVVLPKPLFDQYNVGVIHDYSHCIEFEEPDFSEVSITVDNLLTQLNHFEVSNNDGWDPISRPACRTTDDVAIRPFESDPAALITAINNLPIGGNTSSDIGAKWGVALLDPSARPVIDGMIAGGQVDPKLSGHPLAYEDTEALKVLVLMTDGVNTTRYGIKPEFQSGPAPIWRDPESQQTSVFIESPPWDLPDPEKPWFIGKDTSCSFKKTEAQPKGDNPYQMDWAEIWALFPTGYFGTCFFDKIDDKVDANGDLIDYYTDVYEITANNSTADKQLLDICAAAKAKGVIIFTIGFEAPSHAQTMMKTCASSPAHYYDVQGIEIENAFAGIAQTVQQLKLVH